MGRRTGRPALVDEGSDPVRSALRRQGEHPRLAGRGEHRAEAEQAVRWREESVEHASYTEVLEAGPFRLGGVARSIPRVPLVLRTCRSRARGGEEIALRVRRGGIWKASGVLCVRRDLAAVADRYLRRATSLPPPVGPRPLAVPRDSPGRPCISSCTGDASRHPPGLRRAEQHGRRRAAGVREREASAAEAAQSSQLHTCPALSLRAVLRPDSRACTVAAAEPIASSRKDQQGDARTRRRRSWYRMPAMRTAVRGGHGRCGAPAWRTARGLVHSAKAW